MKAVVGKLTLKIAKLFDTQVCFVAGTKVHTPNGLVNIEDLLPGDLVLSRDEHDVDLTGPVVAKPVVRLIVTHPRQLWHLSLRAASGETETVVTTASHPFFVRERGEFVAAAVLESGQTLVQSDGRTAEVVELRVEHAAVGESFTTYNLEVADAHTYFVGVSGVWVHNASKTLCELVDVLYERYRKQGYNELEAREKLWEILDGRVKSKRISQETFDKTWKDANRAFRQQSPGPGWGDAWIPPKSWNGPSKHGKWLGPKGNSSWIDDRPEVIRIVGRDPTTGAANPIAFYKGRIMIDRYLQAEFRVVGVKGGSANRNADTNLIYKAVFEREGLGRPGELFSWNKHWRTVTNWLEDQPDGYGGKGIRPHHAGGDRIQYQPMELHKIQHTNIAAVDSPE